MKEKLQHLAHTNQPYLLFEDNGMDAPDLEQAQPSVPAGDSVSVSTQPPYSMMVYILCIVLATLAIISMSPGISFYKKVEPLGNSCHSPGPACVWVGSNQTESQLNIGHCNSAYGKTPGMWPVNTTHDMEMEGAGAAAADKLIEFLAILMLMLTILTLTLAISLIICWVFNRTHIRDRVMRWTRGQRSNRAVAVPNIHFISTSEHEGESDSEQEAMSDEMNEVQVSNVLREEHAQPQDRQ